MRRAHVVIQAFLLFSMLSPTLASEHTGYWRQRTPKGKAFACERVTSQRQLSNILQNAGWNTKRGMPTIDWKRQEAVVVAPSKYYEDGRLVFYGLEDHGDTVALEYGWKMLNPTPSTTTPIEDEGGTRLTETRSSSTVAGTAETIVVSYRKGLDDRAQLVCQDTGRDW